MIDIYEDKYFEEVILQGLIVGYAKMDLNEKLKYIESLEDIDAVFIKDDYSIEYSSGLNNSIIMY